LHGATAARAQGEATYHTLIERFPKYEVVSDLMLDFAKGEEIAELWLKTN